MINKRSLQLLAPLTNGSGWFLRNYLVRFDSSEVVDMAIHDREIRRLADEIPAKYLTPDYEYFRIGFIITHYGRRGICVSIWHWGRWNSTNEMFNQCWYTFGREYARLEIHDRREPVICEHEISLLSQELALFHKLVETPVTAHTRAEFERYEPTL